MALGIQAFRDKGETSISRKQACWAGNIHRWPKMTYHVSNPSSTQVSMLSVGKACLSIPTNPTRPKTFARQFSEPNEDGNLFLLFTPSHQFW